VYDSILYTKFAKIKPSCSSNKWTTLGRINAYTFHRIVQIFGDQQIKQKPIHDAFVVFFNLTCIVCHNYIDTTNWFCRSLVVFVFCERFCHWPRCPSCNKYGVNQYRKRIMSKLRMFPDHFGKRAIGKCSCVTELFICYLFFQSLRKRHSPH